MALLSHAPDGDPIASLFGVAQLCNDFLIKSHAMIRSMCNALYFTFDCTGCSVNGSKLLLWILNHTALAESTAESMTITIALNTDNIKTLDISPAVTVIEELLQSGAIASYEQQLRFDINYPIGENDPRELSEIPEVLLWFIRLDARYPWLPFLLDWKAGEFVRYAAMLVPHQFSVKEGILYNPEALEIFLMHLLFVLSDWLQQHGIPSKSRIQSMAQLLGYELEDALFEMF